MLTQKAHHKDLKREVNTLEQERKTDRSETSWFNIRTLKKIKLQAKDKLYAIKQKLHS
tara:strand:+ start:319 stop:492 length:174 start_codon:yes stop_codon:yes gene_type:complete